MVNNYILRKIFLKCMCVQNTYTGMLYIFLSVSSDLSEVTYFWAIIVTQCSIFVIWRAFGALLLCHSGSWVQVGAAADPVCHIYTHATIVIQFFPRLWIGGFSVPF